jgi:hypothetical protein
LEGKYWDVASRLATAENEIGPLKSELAASLVRFQTLQHGLQIALDSGVRVPGTAAKTEHKTAARSASDLSGRELISEFGARIRRRLFT